MTDLGAIATARDAAQAVEAEARALSDQLAGARADLRRLRRELIVLPRRAADLAASLTAARARADAAATDRATVGTALAAAQAEVASADAEVAALGQRIDEAQSELQDLLDLLDEGGRLALRLPPDENGGGGPTPKPNPVLLQRIREKRQEITALQGQLAAAQSRAAAARANVAAVTARVAAADAAVTAAQADVASLAEQLAQVQAAIDLDRGALPAAEARPDQLRTAIAAARERVATAWKPWTDLVAAAHAELATAARARDRAAARFVAAGVAAGDAEDALAAAQRSGDAAAVTTAQAERDAAETSLEDARLALRGAEDALDDARAALVGGDDVAALVSLAGADTPLVLLPARLETRFLPHDDGGADLLVRVFPDTVHVSSHEPELTADELAWGRRFREQEQAATSDDAARRAAWAQLAGRFGPERAAWIARAVEAAGDGDPPRRRSSWTRAPATMVLPDRWIALGYRNGERRFAVMGRPIPDDLALGPAPAGAAPTDPAAPLGEGARWLTDVDRALESGMALRIGLGPDDAAGLDRLVVLGVHVSVDAEEGARRLAALLDAHHYTDGLALVPPGTPTNNTAAARAGWSSADEGYARSWASERGAGAGAGSDAERLTRALGLAGAPLAHAGHAAAVGEADARHMAVALWPATWGYALGQVVGGLSPAALAQARDHVVGHVRGAGPLPALRVGRQPYGVLPATALSRFAPLSPSDLDADLPPILRALAAVWRAAAADLPRVTPTAAIDDVLSAALTMSPTSVAYAARPAALQPDPTGPVTFVRRQRALAVPRALDLDLEPPLAGAGYDPTAVALTGPVVVGEPSETDPLPDTDNYVTWLAANGREAVRAGTPPAGADTLLFALLRHGLLRAYADTAVRILRARGLVEPGEGTEPGLGDPAGPSPWTRLAAPVDGVTDGAPLGAYLDGLRASGAFAASPAAAEVQELAEVQAALDHLAGLPTARLGRLLADGLDVCSHRLDAWVTAHAASALEDLRAGRPAGARLGGYGVLEDVRPAPARTLAQRVAELEAALVPARARAAAAAGARASLSGELAAAQAEASARGAEVRALDERIATAQAQLDALLEAAGEPLSLRPTLKPVEPNGNGDEPGPSPQLLKRIHDKQVELASLRGALAGARARADAAGSTLAAVAARVAAADDELRTAQAEVARLSALFTEAQAAEREALDLATNKGYIHAPSLGQAATAAVLRSGHLAHRREADSPLEIDLSSRRVRLALGLLDGLRQDQPLGALLGYRFERGLHEGHPGLALDQHIATLRALAPLDDSTEAEAQLRDALAREADLAARLGVLELRLKAHRDADQAAKDALRADLATAQAELDAARTSAEALANQLEQAQDALQELLDRVGEGDLPSRIPPWKLRDDDIPGAGIPPALMAQINAKRAQIRSLTSALDTANAAQRAAETRVGDISAQLGVADPQIATLEQAITDLQPELDTARAAVAAARARLEELRGELRERAAEAVRANNVVDGLALRRRWKAGTAQARWDTSTIPFGDAEIGLPALGTAEQQAIDAELRAVDDAVDALSDLLVAESVHHLVQGNPTRAGATVDALSRGEAPPPEPDVVRTPRGGIGVTHRLLVVLDPNGPAGEGWPTSDAEVRAKVDPALEAWAARLLGPAARVRARGRYVAHDGTELATAEVGLDALGISALDVVAAAAAAAPSGATEIELGLLDHLRRHRPDGVAPEAEIALEPARDPAWGPELLSLGELLEVARQVRDVLVSARPLDARDVAAPGAAVGDGVDAADLARRAEIAVGALEDARTALAGAVDAGAARDALLLAAAVGVPGAVPLGGDDDVTAQRATVLQELDRRRAAAAAAKDGAARIAAVLGPDWRVLGRVTPADPAELAAAFGASDELQAGDQHAAATWLTRAAHVREGAGRLDGALMYAEALGSPERLALRVAQLPHRPGDRWAALPSTPDHPIEGGRLSLVAQAAGAPVAEGTSICGLVIDEWTEVVPAATQVTGVGFHFDQPNSRAPQAILLAVPPAQEGVWSLDALEAVVLETLDLARMRMADPEALARAGSTGDLPGTGHYLPAILLAAGPAEETVTTDLGRVVAPA